MAEKEPQTQHDGFTPTSSFPCPALWDSLGLDRVTPVRGPGTLGGRGQHPIRNLRCLDPVYAQQLWGSLFLLLPGQTEVPKRKNSAPNPCSCPSNWWEHSVEPAHSGSSTNGSCWSVIITKYLAKCECRMRSRCVKCPKALSHWSSKKV